MGIILKLNQEAWLKSRVAKGDFTSVDEAAQQLIGERIAEYELDEDDMAWAKPFVDEADAAIARGEIVTLDEHKARMARLLAMLKG